MTRKVLLKTTTWLAVVTLTVVCGLGLNAQEGLTLADALDIAENNSPRIRTSQLSLIRSQENLNAQRAAMKSNLSLAVTPFQLNSSRPFNMTIGDFQKDNSISSNTSFRVLQPIVSTDATVTLQNTLSHTNVWGERYRIGGWEEFSDRYFQNRLTLSVDQPLFTYNRRKMQLQELEYSLENAEISHVLQRLNLERQVTQTFYGVYQQQQSLEIALKAYQNMQQNHEITKVKAEAGLIAEAELYQAELNLANSRSDYENRLVGLENAKDNFKILVGMSLYDDFIALPDIRVDTISVDVAFAIDQGLQNRLELRQRQISLEQSQFDMIRTLAQNEFKGSVNFSVGMQGNNSNFFNIYEESYPTSSVAVRFDIPVFDWGEKKARVRATEASMESVEISYQDEVNSIIQNVRQVYRNLLNLRNQIEIQRQSVENAELTYELNLERYRNGDLTGMDLNRFQEQLSNAQISYTNALISYKLELLNLKIQTLYDFETGEPLTPMSLIKID